MGREGKGSHCSAVTWEILAHVRYGCYLGLGGEGVVRKRRGGGGGSSEEEEQVRSGERDGKERLGWR